MKIQCNVCEIAEAKVLCCADEAALCWSCDEKVHAANKLATKHQRVSLSSSPMPKCDICQEAVGYFFCLEDRALLCRKCDVAIHTVNAHVSAHRRFLLTGVKVGLLLQSTEQEGASGKLMLDSSEKISQTESSCVFRKGTPMSSAGQYNKVLPLQVGDFSASKLPFAGGSAAAGSIPQWQLDDFGLTEFNQTFGYMDNGSSKADSGKLGDSDCFPNLRAGEELDADECLGQVPEASWTVPQIHSPPTASGLYWPKHYRPVSDAEVFVPDICCSPMQNPAHYQPTGTGSKRRRGF